MILKGKKLQEPNKVFVVIPRGDDPDDTIILTAQAILEMDEFDSLCPRPKPPVIRFKTGESRQDIDDPRFQAELNKYGELRTAYMIVKSLEATEGLEWETVKLSQPETWLNYEKELRSSGFSDIEVQRITLGVLEANALNETKINKARDSFLAGRAAANGSLSPSSGQSGTPFGVPLND